MKYWIVLLFFTTGNLYSQTIKNEDALLKKANKLAQKYIITDGHVDLPYRLKVTNFKLQKEYLGIPVSYTHLTLPTSDLV